MQETKAIQNLKQSFILEKNLLHAMSDRSTYEAYKDILCDKYAVPETRVLIDAYRKYFDLYKDKQQIDFDEFATNFLSSWMPAHAEEKRDYYVECVFPRLKEAPNPDCNKSLLGLVNQEFINGLSVDTLSPTEILDGLDRYENKYNMVCGEEDPNKLDLRDDLFTRLDRSKGLPTPYPTMTNHFNGGILKGDFIVISALKNAGKSAMIYDFITTILNHNLKHPENGPIMLFNSEGTCQEAFGRVMSNLFKNDVKEGYQKIVTNEKQVKEFFFDKYGENALQVYKMQEASSGYIKHTIRKNKPCIILVDMLDYINTPKDGHSTASYQMAYQTMRHVAADYCPVIGTTQAGDSAMYLQKQDDGTWRKVYKRYLELNDMYGSNTGKQGAVSAMIGIGMDDPFDNVRYINVPTDKLGNGRCRFTCTFAPKYSTYEEV